MKRIALTLATIAAVALPLPAAKVEGFLNSWDDAVAKAKKENKPIYLHFTTTWCGWCRKIEKDTYASDKGKKALKNFVAASLDCTVPRGQAPTGQKKTNIQLMRKWGGSGYPFLVMVTPDGQILKKISGYIGPDKFVKQTDQALETQKMIRKFEKYAAKADKDTLEYNIKALKHYSRTEELDKAMAAAEVVLQKDGDNKLGLVETATMVKVEDLMDKVRRAKSKEQAKPHLEGIAMLLSDLTSKDIKLKEPFRIHFLIGGINASLGNMDQAVTSLETALKHAPNDNAKTRIKSIIKQIKSQQTGK